jgi:hypothetical protein
MDALDKSQESIKKRAIMELLFTDSEKNLQLNLHMIINFHACEGRFYNATFSKTTDFWR